MMPVGAAIGAGTAVIGAGAQMYGANKAADAQTHAADMANATLREQYAQNQTNLTPWMQQGQQTNNTLSYLLGTGNTPGAGYNGSAGGAGSLTQRFNPTMDQLAQTPGYQFTLDQGLKSTQNSYASKGLASSGAAMKGAADYTTGLASNTYQQQFQNYWGQNKSIYDMLTGQASQGLQAAGALAGSGNTLAMGQSNNTIGAGNAQAAGWNAMGTGINNAAQGVGQYALLSGYLGNSNGTAAATPWTNRGYGTGVSDGGYNYIDAMAR